MVKKKIIFTSLEEVLSFCTVCQKMQSDIDLTDMGKGNFRIDGKSLLGLLSINLKLPMLLMVDGEDEDLSHEYFANYEFEDTRKYDNNISV